MTNKVLNSSNLLEVKDLQVHFPIRKGIMNKVVGYVHAVDKISFSISRGETFALVGESGCGKTTTALAISGLVKKTSGSIQLSLSKNENMSLTWESLSRKEKGNLRKHIQMIFQDPYSSLNPRMTVRSILDEPLVVHKVERSKRQHRINELLSQVGLSSEYLHRFPHEFSGGQRQRIGIARALANYPEFIIADEPVSALDVSIQAQIVNLLQDLQKQYNLTQLIISHDLAVIRHLANRCAVMYAGRIVEMGTEDDIFSRPQHPYTQLLLASVPVPGKGRLQKQMSESVTEKEAMTSWNRGCAFAGRCSRCQDKCKDEIPCLESVDGTHVVSCFYPGNYSM